MMLWKCCIQYARQQIWKTQQWPQDWKSSVFIPVPKKDNAKEHSSYHTTVLISHTSKVPLKILQPGFSSMWTENFQIYKLGLEKRKEPEIKLPTFAGSWKKQDNSPQNLLLHYYVKAFDCVDHNKLWKTLKEMGIPDHLRNPSSGKPVCRPRSNS